MLDTITRSDNPRAASQAANTSRMMGVILASVKWLFRIVTVIITNNDSIMPSKQSREDMRWDRYMSSPIRDVMKARKMLAYTIVIW